MTQYNKDHSCIHFYWTSVNPYPRSPSLIINDCQFSFVIKLLTRVWGEEATTKIGSFSDYMLLALPTMWPVSTIPFLPI